ncbi:MAG TPA: zinc ABC transporter substrate-binding protein, partial [Pontiella sp.]
MSDMKGTVLILGALLLAGCAEQKDANLAPSRPNIFVSIPPQAGLLKSICGNHINVHTLVAEGQSPHAYEPTAKQLAVLGTADALFTIGVPFERTLLKKITSIYPNLPIFRTESGIPQRSISNTHVCQQCTHDHGEKDPHVWLSPSTAETIAQNMLTALKNIDPDHEHEFKTSFEQLSQQLKDIDSLNQKKLEKYRGRRFYVFHPSFGYFADTYELEQIPVELDGKSPSPRQLARLIEQAKEDGVKVIFVQKQFPIESASAVANAINGTVAALDPLAEDIV